VMNLVDVHGHAIRAESAAVGGVQFQGNLRRSGGTRCSRIKPTCEA
jgi:hypothetical protein